MKIGVCFRILLFGAVLTTLSFPPSVLAANIDLRGVWVGKANGSIFGAEGSVTITRQKGEYIVGVVEGGNLFGTAKFGIKGHIRGNMIYGNMGGNRFVGAVYTDGTIRGELKAVDGDTYEIFLRRSYPYWGGVPSAECPGASPIRCGRPISADVGVVSGAAGSGDLSSRALP
jgi:hypothetical protein